MLSEGHKGRDRKEAVTKDYRLLYRESVDEAHRVRENVPSPKACKRFGGACKYVKWGVSCRQ